MNVALMRTLHNLMCSAACSMATHQDVVAQAIMIMTIIIMTIAVIMTITIIKIIIKSVCSS